MSPEFDLIEELAKHLCRQLRNGEIRHQTLANREASIYE